MARPGLFARLSLDYADHPKIAVLSDAAFRAHIEMILYARKYETDGRIINRVANRIASQWDTDVLTELQTNDPSNPSLVKLDDGDYFLHGYEDMQETKAEIEERRARNAENGRKGGRPKGSKKTQSVNQSLSQSGTQKKAESETEPYKERRDSADAELPDHPQAVHLCEVLQQLIVENGSKKPTITKQWLDEARRMIDIDKRDPAKAERLIRWAQANSFWRPNIRSMPTFRKQYDQLRLQANREWEQAGHQPDGAINPDAVLGPDNWSLPPTPEDLEPSDYQAWVKQVTEQHRQERHEQAQLILERRSA